jgi:uncharacterized protein (TIGR00106 family)
MLFELSVIPLGADIHISDELADVLEVVDRSGLRYRLGPTSTSIEGNWEDVMGTIRECHHAARRKSKHVITLIKVEDDEGQTNKLEENVESVEAKSERPLQTAGGLPAGAAARP